MSTPAFRPELSYNDSYLKENCIVEKQKDTRTIIRKEIKRAEEIKKVQEEYKAGKISKFEYQAAMFFLNLKPVMKNPSQPIFSTTA